ncbi:MAG TPA: MFS transporter [Planctomycetota bacterium]|nr:MFS transporter [Planctomycetota bacterium]
MSAPRAGSAARSAALRFVLTMGVVNLLADMTYEGGASLNGPFLASLGASAAAISIVAGLGEFLGYVLRPVAGVVADRLRRPWLLTFIGYVLNQLAVPALALAAGLPAAMALVLAERAGRAIRKPSVEAMLSYTTGSLGKGWAYALNSALDETGALLGPLLMALVLFRGGDARAGYALLLLPAGLTLLSLTGARVAFPGPARLEVGHTASARGFSRRYWVYMLAASCFAAGLMSFEFISVHLQRGGLVAGAAIPALLALATLCGIVASLVLGKLFDRHGMPVVVGAVLVSAAFSPLVFLGELPAVVAGMLLWGVGYATQDTLFKAVIASVLPERRRSSAFGLFYAGYGLGWLLGSVVTGLLYEPSRGAVVAFSVTTQVLAAGIFFTAGRRRS